MKDLSDKIVSALFDLAESDGGLVKSRAVERVREVLAAAEQVKEQHSILSAADDDAMSAMGTVPYLDTIKSVEQACQHVGAGVVKIGSNVMYLENGKVAYGTVQVGGPSTLHLRHYAEDDTWDRVADKIIKRRKKEDADEIAAAMTFPPKKPP